MAQFDVFSLAIEGLGASGQQLVNRMYYEQSSAVGDNDGTLLIDAWYASCMAQFQDMIGVDIAVTEMHTRNLNQPLFGIDYALSPTLAGTVTGDGLPPQCAGCLQFTTGLIGKQNRGRNYLWPTGESMQNHGQWNSTYQGLVAAYGAVIETITAGSSTWRLVVLAGVDPGATPLGIVVTEVTLDPIVRTQRRRVIGFGS